VSGADDFNRRIMHLEREVGEGRITAGCTVDQIYAQNQHQNTTFRHTKGRSHYLGAPLMEDHARLLAKIARSVITKEGSRLKGEMRDTAETMAGYVLKNAPRDPDIGDVLANSGSPWVSEMGFETYRRPPIAPREAEDHE
jgi:hypothetical protein